MVAMMRLMIMVVAIRECTAAEERFHFRIVVPEFINTLTHTKTVYVLPKKGRSLGDGGLATALGAAGGGKAIATYRGPPTFGYGTSSAYSAMGPSPLTNTGFGSATGGAAASGSGGYGFSNALLQETPSFSGKGNALTPFGHSSPKRPAASVPSATSASLPVMFPLRATPLPAPPPPGTIIVSAAHDASLAELLSHSTKVRNALRSQDLLHGATHSSGEGSTATPVRQVASADIQSERNKPALFPDLQSIYDFYGLSTNLANHASSDSANRATTPHSKFVASSNSMYSPSGSSNYASNGDTHHRSKPKSNNGISGPSSSGNDHSQDVKSVKCHHNYGSNFVSASGTGSGTLSHLQDDQSASTGHAQSENNVNTTPQAHVQAPVHSLSQSHGHGFFGSGSGAGHGPYTSFTTAQTSPVIQNHSFNRHSNHPDAPTYSSALRNSLKQLPAVQTTQRPATTPSSGQLNHVGYISTQVHSTMPYNNTNHLRPSFSAPLTYSLNSQYKHKSNSQPQYNFNGHTKYGLTGPSKYAPTDDSKWVAMSHPKYSPSGHGSYDSNGHSKFIPHAHSNSGNGAHYDHNGNLNYGLNGHSDYESTTDSHFSSNSKPGHGYTSHLTYSSGSLKHASSGNTNHASSDNTNHATGPNSQFVVSGNSIYHPSGSFNYAPSDDTIQSSKSNSNYGINGPHPTGLSDNSQYVYHGNKYKQAQYNSYGKRLPTSYETQPFTLADNPHHAPLQEYKRPEFYQASSNHYLPSSSSVISKPQDFRDQKELKYKTEKKTPSVKCLRDEKSGLICIASTNVQRNSGNSTKILVGDAWAKTKHYGSSKDQSSETTPPKDIRPIVDYDNDEHKTEERHQADKSHTQAEFGGVEDHVSEVTPASEETSTSTSEAANYETDDHAVSMTTSDYGPKTEDETPEEQPEASEEQSSMGFSSAHGSRHVEHIVENVGTGRGGDSARSELKTGFRLPAHQNDQWTPINPTRLDHDDSFQDESEDKREAKIRHYNIKDITAEYYATPTPLKSTTVVLGINRDYKPLKVFFGKQAHVETTPAPTQISNLKYGDMLWSMVRGNMGSAEVTKPANDLPTTTVSEDEIKLSNGLGIDDHLNLVNGWGSHIDGTEDALARPEAFPEDSRPADISSEVHLTTTSPDGMALYYQNEAEEENDSQKRIVEHTGEDSDDVSVGPSADASVGPSADSSSDEDHDKEETQLSTTIPSTTTKRFRGRVKYSSHLHTTPAPPKDKPGRRKKVHQGESAPDVETEVSGNAVEGVAEDTTEESHEEGEAEGTDKPGALLDQLRKDVETHKDTLQNVLDRHNKGKGPKIISETGHILRGLAVAEQLEEQQW